MASAGERGPTESGRALATLCEAYWYPVYAFVRRHGHSADDAQDLTQGFFAALLERRRFFRVADRERGRFRSFLLTALKRCLAKEHEKAAAQKRGGGQAVLSLDYASAEDRHQSEPAAHATPERIFERRWALTVLDEVMGRAQR